MTFFEWRDEYNLNIKKIDEQHKKLIKLIDDLATKMKEKKSIDVLNKVVAELDEYTKTHFSFEEKLMEEYEYPEYKLHKNEHDYYTQKVFSYKERLYKNSFALSTEILITLKEWWEKHILVTDKKYAPFLIEKGVN